jgi:hypothetical protein
MPIKILLSILILSTLILSPISTAANILDDLKNGFGQDKNNAKNETKKLNNQTQLELDDTDGESKKICEIQKGYAAKHFENRQLERSSEIQEKIAAINKIKLLLTNNKQDLKSLEATIETLLNLLKQKLELLNTRVKSANSINCSDSQNPRTIKENLRELNLKLNQLGKDIRNQTREFGAEVQMLIIKIKQPKVE